MAAGAGVLEAWAGMVEATLFSSAARSQAQERLTLEVKLEELQQQIT
jgi:hypothetical protein